MKKISWRGSAEEEWRKWSAEEKWLKINVMDCQFYISKLNIIFWHLCAVNSATVGALLSKKYIRVPHPNPDVSVSALMDYGLTVRAFFQHISNIWSDQIDRPNKLWNSWSICCITFSTHYFDLYHLHIF